ncbi:MAG TPA: glycoside hydrolase family 36 protein [Propionicimonas sp.]|jgi:alpha-galactosidase
MSGRDAAAPVRWAWSANDLVLGFEADEGPVELISAAVSGGPSGVRRHRIVEVVVAGEHHARSALGYTGTTVGSRLRYLGHDARAGALTIRQRDAVTGLDVTSHWRATGPASIQVWHEVRNGGDRPVTLFAVSSLCLKTAAPAASRRYSLVEGRGEWLGDGAWSVRPLHEVLRELRLDTTNQDGRGRYAVISTGGWSTGTVYPTAVLVDISGPAIAWQAEVTAGWLWELAQHRDGTVLNVLGPADQEHQWSLTLAPGAEFTTAPAGVALGDGLDGAMANLTAHRRGIRDDRSAGRSLPVVYNDFMNTLMGNPTTEALVPLIDAASDAGAEYFCIDAGWYDDDPQWGSVGEWVAAPTRFTGGLPSVLSHIRERGMVPGLWLEPEIIGLDSPALRRLPDEAYFLRCGTPTVEHHRRHLDLRHPAARQHLDAAIDRVVDDYGAGYVKLDYNIEPGAGTDRTGSAGDGLLGHGRALRQWLLDIKARHPELLVENCASGAMRMDYALLSVTHLQSTSDNQDAARSAVVACTAPMSVLPEQAGNWAYPATEMSDGELTLTLVNGLAGRLYLSGFLDRLSPAQRRLVHEAVALHKQLRAWMATASPCWPTGLPGWDDDVLTLGYRGGGQRALFVWTRGAATDVRLRTEWAGLQQTFPHGPAWPAPATAEGLTLRVPAGPDAAVFLA